MDILIINDIKKAKELKFSHKKAAIIWSENINPKIVSEIGNGFKDCIALSVSDDESCKEFKIISMIISNLINFKLDKSDVIIGIGSESVLDLTTNISKRYLGGIKGVYISNLNI